MNPITLFGIATFAIALGWAMGTPLPFGVAVAVLVSVIFVWITVNRVDGALKSGRELEKTLVAAGSVIAMRVSVSAQGAFRFCWLELQDSVPEGAQVRGSSATFVVGMLQAGAKWMYLTELTRRGVYRFGPIRVRYGDLLGVHARSLESEEHTDIYVHPRIFPLTNMNLPSHRPFGDLRTNAMAFEDPTRPAGTREYRQGDSLKRIHWTATARAMRLIAKEYDGSIVPIGTIAIDRNPQNYANLDDYELAFSIAASLLVSGTYFGYDIGIQLESSLAPGRGELHIEKALTMLASTSRTEDTLAQQLATIRTSLSWRGTLILITSHLPTDVAALLDIFRHSGHAVSVAVVGKDARADVALGAASNVCTAVAQVRNEEEISALHFITLRY